MKKEKIIVSQKNIVEAFKKAKKILDKSPLPTKNRMFYWRGEKITKANAKEVLKEIEAYENKGQGK